MVERILLKKAWLQMLIYACMDFMKCNSVTPHRKKDDIELN